MTASAAQRPEPKNPVDPELFRPSDTFARRHIGPRGAGVERMLEALEVSSLAELVDQTIPSDIRYEGELEIPSAATESEALGELRDMMAKNQVRRSYIGMGYHGCITPPVIQRNVLENPGWYTQYTPYQAEISQGRLEALLNFQTMVADLCGLPQSNASLLDEATAAAEAMTLAQRVSKEDRRGFFVVKGCHPQTVAIVKTRALPLGIEIHEGDIGDVDFVAQDLFGVLVQYPDTRGRLRDYRDLASSAHDRGALVIAATDLLALALCTPPGEWGADIAIGSSQRFGVPMGYGGPHAAFIATREEYRRQVPGRLVGVSKDAQGNMAYRLALQTREQHIRRDKATSNICTAQVLLAVMASMYAVYHGPDGVRRIARRVHALTTLLQRGLGELGFDTGDAPFFDTLTVATDASRRAAILEAADDLGINFRRFADGSLGVALDETTRVADVQDVLSAFAAGRDAPETTQVMELLEESDLEIPGAFARSGDILAHDVFSTHQGEHEMLRYLHRLQARDLSLTTSMIPLGSCTMKLNATAEMIPVTWPEVGSLHPFVPDEQARGYHEMFAQLEAWLANITGFAATSLQPNAGSQGEYAGLLAIHGYHASRGDEKRNVCLIPVSAHGTNPASAVMAGFRVVAVKCDEAGNVDVADLEARAAEHADRLGALMITYPSTHGVFEASIQKVCRIVHEHGGQVYLDGANMNAQVGLTRPGDYGADVCHLNLHKTFCIPHGGGGPGMGPICVAKHLAPFLPARVGHDETALGPVSAAPYGSASILPISWMYIRMMGPKGLRRASEVAIGAANYMAQRLAGEYDLVYTGPHGRVAHEFIIDARGFKKTADITVDDIAKRLVDLGFHAPTMSFPVAGTLMIEPTESESMAELDRFCDAMITIRAEIRAIEDGTMDRANNPLKNAPHTAQVIAAPEWDRPYSRQQAAFAVPWLRDHKFWPHVGRVDNTWGDRNPMCLCPSVEDMAASS